MSDAIVNLGDKLTHREWQVLRGMSDGLRNAAIGKALWISEDTVKTHARRLLRKLGARDRAHAVRLGFDAGLLAAPGDPAGHAVKRVRAALDDHHVTRLDARAEGSRYAALYDAIADALHPPS